MISMKKGTILFISVQTRSKSNPFKVSKLFLLLYKTEPSERRHNVWQAAAISSLMVNFSAAITLGECCFMTSAMTAGCVFVTRMNSSVSPSMSLEASGSEGVSSWRTDARGKNDGLASFMGYRCMAWAGASPKLSCSEELSAKRRSSLVERFEGGLHDGESSTQRFTEHSCSSCICICIHLCLKSLALDTNPSHLLHISVERESLSVMSIPQTFRIFEERSSLLPSFLLALPKTRVKWRLSNASQQNRQIKFRGWISLGVDSRQFSEFCSFYAARMASFAGDFLHLPEKLITSQ